VEQLIALARNAYESEFTPERREQIRQRVLERLDRAEREWEQRRRRRRMAARVLLAGASTVLLAGLLVKLVRAARPWVTRTSAVLAKKRLVRYLTAG
jgi:hypothetical protein